MARDHLAPRRRHHARHNKMVRRMAIINRKKGSAQAWRFKTSRHRRRFNPGHDADFVKHFRDGGRIEVWNDGEVCVFDNMDRDQDDYYLKPHEVPALIRDVNAAKFGAWHHYTKDMVRDDYEMQGRGKKRNPRGRKRGGRSFTKARRGHDWERAVHSSLPWFANPRRGRGRRRNPGALDMSYYHPGSGREMLKIGRKQWGRKLRTPEEYRAMRLRYSDKHHMKRGRIGGKGKFDNADDVIETLRAMEQMSGSFWKHGMHRGDYGRRRNPDVHGNAGKAHPAYGQYLLKLGFGMNDPIVELGAAWARGEAGGSRLIQQAIISAERSMESRDRRVAQSAKNVANKLRSYLKEQERHEGYRHKSGFKEGSLVGSFRYANPRRRGRGRR